MSNSAETDSGSRTSSDLGNNSSHSTLDEPPIAAEYRKWEALRNNAVLEITDEMTDPNVDDAIGEKAFLDAYEKAWGDIDREYEKWYNDNKEELMEWLVDCAIANGADVYGDEC